MKWHEVGQSSFWETQETVYTSLYVRQFFLRSNKCFWDKQQFADALIYTSTIAPDFQTISITQLILGHRCLYENYNLIFLRDITTKGTTCTISKCNAQCCRTWVQPVLGLDSNVLTVLHRRLEAILSVSTIG